MKNLKYEQAVKKLEEIVLKLEKGDLPLDETIRLYEEATKLSGYCSAMLDNAKLQIENISTEKGNGDE